MKTGINFSATIRRAGRGTDARYFVTLSAWSSDVPAMIFDNKHVAMHTADVLIDYFEEKRVRETSGNPFLFEDYLALSRQ